MKLFKSKCAHCKTKLEEGKELKREVKIPQFLEPRIKNFCTEEHYQQFLVENQGTPSRKPYCMNCDD
jgi:hypothetical protein